MSWACEVISRGRHWPFFGVQRKKMVREEFERLSLSQLPWLYTCAHYLTKERGIAEGLVQDTYLQAYRCFNTYEAGTNCRVWLLSIMYKLFVRRYRKRIGKPEIINWNSLDQDYGSMVTPQNQPISQFSDWEVEEAVKELPEDYRLALILVDIEELSYQEAARVMECPISRLRSSVSRGRWMLQVVLRKHVRPRDRVGENL